MTMIMIEKYSDHNLYTWVSPNDLTCLFLQPQGVWQNHQNFPVCNTAAVDSKVAYIK